MTVGLQAVQSTHAAIEFIFNFPELSRQWHESNYLIQVTVESEQELESLLAILAFNDSSFSAFREPDMDNQLTAICVEPSPVTQKLISQLPLLK